jgi:hypothetical protein
MVPGAKHGDRSIRKATRELPFMGNFSIICGKSNARDDYIGLISDRYFNKTMTVFQVLPKRNCQFTTGFFQAGETVSTLSTFITARAATDLIFSLRNLADPFHCHSYAKGSQVVQEPLIIPLYCYGFVERLI